MGVVGGVQDTPPATVGAVMELIPSAFMQALTTVPTEWVNVGKDDLAGPLPWYKSIPGTADATEEAPGLLVGAGTGSQFLTGELRGVFEFKTSTAPANTPAALVLAARMREEKVKAAQLRERARFLAVLAVPGQPTGPPS